MSGEETGRVADGVNPAQVEVLWRIRERLGPPLSDEEAQLLNALRAALAGTGSYWEAHDAATPSPPDDPRQ